MNSPKPLTTMLLLVAVFLGTVLGTTVGTASAQQFIIKKKRLAVIVEQTPFCPQGIAVAGDALGGLKLCVDYPVGIVDRLEPFIGSTVEIEARWTFLPDPHRKAPVAIGEVSMIGDERIGEPRGPSEVRTAVAVRSTPSAGPVTAFRKRDDNDGR